MNNCVFWTIYGDHRYLQILKASVESFIRHRFSCDLLVFTDIENANESLPEDVKVIKAEFTGGRSQKMSKRFEIASKLLKKYDKVLHVDTDVIASSSYEELFSIESEKISFASESPPHDLHDLCFFAGNPHDKAVGEFWAGPLLNQEDRNKFAHVPSICVGVWLVNKKHVDWLLQIYEDVTYYENLGFEGVCADQHAVVRNLMINERWDLQLQRFVTHYGQKLENENSFKKLKESKNCIVHFAGGVQPTEKKMSMMLQLLEWSKNDQG